MTDLLWIALAGGVGSVARYLLGGWVQKSATTTFPIGTMLVNIVGCLIIGFLTTALSARLFVLREEVRLGIAVGFLGGFTTFSAFTMESAALINGGELLRAGLNILLSVGLGLLGVWLGARIANGLA